MAITVAVAGAGALGKAIIDVLKVNDEYKVVVIARKRKPGSDIPVIEVDYDQPDAITSSLDQHNVHTVVCTIAVTDEGSCRAQLSLIRAAEKCKTVKRFIPSDFGIQFNEKQTEVFPLVAFKLAASNRLRATNLEYTLFHCGFFLDFYGFPRITSLKDPFPLVVDIENNVAAIPGTGDVPCVFTHTLDVAKFVVAALGMDKWPEHLFMAGDKFTWNELVSLAEEVKGTKFKVTHDDPSDLAKGRLTILPAHETLFKTMPSPFATRLLSALEYWSTLGEFDFPEKDSLNKIFPKIETLRVKEVLERNHG